jgi:alginate O-acetyltransferase complex protein AlgI
MIFNSLSYILLLIIVVPMYWMLPYRSRLFLIFFSSLLFYGFWRIDFIPLLMSSVLVDYLVAIKIHSSVGKARKKYLFVSLFFNLGLLIYFKYLIFFSETAVGFANLLGFGIDPIMLNIILPIGISFYTFQTISYTVDVYRGYIAPEKDIILYSCYVTFFPQLVAGPVLRFKEVAHQFLHRETLRWENVAIGLKRIIFGLFLKVVLADNIASLVDAGFEIPVENMSAIDVWTLAFLFGFQIYFDFSAYSHIAIGSAKLLGIHFPENFNFPYFSKSPKDFWRRWHISLSSWIRDYLYLPLAKKHVHDKSIGGLSHVTIDSGKNKALFLTWAIMGLWHGASLTFIIWGLYHALVILIYRIISPLIFKINENLRVLAGISLTLPIMMLSWVPFRADSVDMAVEMWLKVLNPYLYNGIGMRENTYLITFLILIGVFLTSIMYEKIICQLKDDYPKMYFLGEITLFVILISLVIVFLQPGSQFIYFQF